MKRQRPREKYAKPDEGTRLALREIRDFYPRKCKVCFSEELLVMNPYGWE